MRKAWTLGAVVRSPSFRFGDKHGQPLDVAAFGLVKQFADAALPLGAEQGLNGLSPVWRAGRVGEYTGDAFGELQVADGRAHRR